MDYKSMSREELIERIREIDEYMDNVIVFWGGKREFRETFADVARNENKEFTEDEARDAAIILETDGAFDQFVEMVRDSFDRGGINFTISEKISAIMQEVASRHAKR